MSQSNDTSDRETLELYLDHELDAASLARVDQRLMAEPALRARLDRLERTRAVRLEAMSTAFDTDAASVERLVASVRDARAAELAGAKPSSRWWIRPAKSQSYFAAAACLACGLLVGAQLQRQQNYTLGGRVDAPTASVGRAGIIENASFGLAGHGAYIVTLVNASGVEIAKLRFDSAEQAQQYVRSFKSRPRGNGANTLNLSDARIDKASY